MTLTTSPDCGQVLPAFVGALHAIEMVPKGETANTGKYVIKYASLAAVLAEVRRACAAHDLAITQYAYIDADVGALKVATTVMHTSGEWVTFPPLPFKMPSDPQQLGSALTYGKRYSLVSIFGIATEDDDGKAAAKTSKASQPQRPKPERPAAATGHTIGDAQMRKLRAVYGSVGIKLPAEQKHVSALILGVDRIDTHSTLTVDQASRLIDRLTAVEAGYVEFVTDANGVVTGLVDAQPEPLDLDGDPDVGE